MMKNLRHFILCTTSVRAYFMYYVEDSEGWETGFSKPRATIRNLALIAEKNMYITGYWQSGHLVKYFLIHRKVNNTVDLIL